jgi:hypothetical protein
MLLSALIWSRPIDESWSDGVRGPESPKKMLSSVKNIAFRLKCCLPLKMLSSDKKKERKERKGVADPILSSSNTILSCTFKAGRCGH